MKIAFFTENRGRGKLPRTDLNMRTDLAWMAALQSDHYHLLDDLSSVEEKYDIGIFTILYFSKEFKISFLSS